MTKLEFSRGDVIAGKYEVTDLLDEGPLGLTYRVKHLKTGKYVRIQMLRPKLAGREQKDSILASFKLAKQISHPHLVKLGELGEHEGVAYYTFEDFEGSTLRELLQEYKISGKQFAVKDAAQIMTQILEAVQATHEGDLIVRALRPEYVLCNVRYTGPRRQTFVAQTKLLHVGFWDLVPSAVLAEDEYTRGEAQYMAPELKSFEPVPTPRADVYSVGVIFYEMLVGTAPVGTFQHPKARRPDLPDHVNDVIELALAQAPEDRYQSARDFITDIQRTFQDVMLAEKTERRPLVTPLGWLLALATVAFVSVMAYQFRPKPELENAAKDSQIRAAVIEQHPKPPPGDATAVTARHPKGMVYIPAGPFVHGRLHSESTSELASVSEAEAEVVVVDAYMIDALEFPNEAGAPPQYAVTHGDAAKLCEEKGKRLCTELEWEKACKGPKNFIYSYGDTFDPDFCGDGLADVGPAKAFPKCKSGWNVYDMSGNFREWTDTSPKGKPNRKIVKGGLRSNPQRGTRCASGTDESVGLKTSSLSFRCCRDADAPPVPDPAPEAEN